MSAAQQTAHDAAAVRGALERVFERPELAPPGDDWLSDMLDELFEGLGATAVTSEAAGWVLLILLGIALGLFGAWLGRQMSSSAGARRRFGRTEVAPALAGAAPDDRVGELRRQAREARARGELALALRLGFAALLIGLGRAGGLEYRDTWTARELLARGRPEPEVERALAPLVEEIDAQTFGTSPVRAADLDQLDELGARWLERRGGRP